MPMDGQHRAKQRSIKGCLPVSRPARHLDRHPEVAAVAAHASLVVQHELQALRAVCCRSVMTWTL